MPFQLFQGPQLRVRPDTSSFIEHHIDKPNEIHPVEFESEQDFKNLMQGEERMKFLRLKEQSIKVSILIQGTKLGEQCVK